MLALRKARYAASPPFLRGGFRPFFLGGAAWAAAALLLWLLAFLGKIELPSALDALAWHRHEMLFGFVGAVVAGFLLTAVPNWTGRLPVAGLPLAALAGLWLAARLALLWSGIFSIVGAMLLDVGFFLALAFVAGREVLGTRNHNVQIVGLVLLLAVADAADYAAAGGVIADGEAGFRAGIALIVMMISLIGGRILPSFTRNWMSRQGISTRLPTQPGRFDLATLIATALALLGWTFAPESRASALALGIAGLLQAVRLARWGGWRTRRDPLVQILHLGYLWIPIGLLLLAGSIVGAAIPRTAALHALTAGAMATMILAVMTRTSLSLTGRALNAGRATVALFLLVTIGAIIRVGAPLGLIDHEAGIVLAGASWGGAFLLFLGAYAPVLLRSRAGRPDG